MSFLDVVSHRPLPKSAIAAATAIATTTATAAASTTITAPLLLLLLLLPLQHRPAGGPRVQLLGVRGLGLRVRRLGFSPFVALGLGFRPAWQGS